jgi:hypothetical protein
MKIANRKSAQALHDHLCCVSNSGREVKKNAKDGSPSAIFRKRKKKKKKKKKKNNKKKNENKKKKKKKLKRPVQR